jgi:meckelin
MELLNPMDFTTTTGASTALQLMFHQLVRWLQTTSTTTSTTTDSIARISFTSYYTTDLTTFFVTLTIFFVIQLVITVLFFALRYYNWNIRNSRVVQSATLTTSLGGINWRNVFEICLIFLNTYVLCLFPFTVLVSWYFFVFFKLQSVPSVLLPLQHDMLVSGSTYIAFIGNLVIMTLFQIAYVLMMIVYRQSKNHLFFVDWEPKSSASSSSTEQKVSVWRTILVANEYCEMQTIRRSNIVFTLFLIGFMLLGLQLDNNALTHPTLAAASNDNTLQINIVLRFANTTFFWLVFSVGQYLWKYFIYERYLSEPPEQVFLDFCTIAKVSILVVDEKYHGYYLHCRSPHQFAESTMVELVEMLGREEAGLTTDRSLDGAPADVQSFELFLSAEWAAEFRRIKSQLIIPKTINDMLDQRRQRQALIGQQESRMNNQPRSSSLWGVSQRAPRIKNRYGGIKVGWSMFLQQTLPPEKVVTAWNEMLQFLSEFIENNLQLSGLRHVVLEESYTNSLFRTAPDLSVPGQPSVLRTDRDWRFTSIWFLGREMDLLLFNILTYSVLDLMFGNTALSIMLCYLCDWLLCQARQSLGQVSRSLLSLDFI